jgi:hypothetical protein
MVYQNCITKIVCCTNKNVYVMLRLRRFFDNLERLNNTVYRYDLFIFVMKNTQRLITQKDINLQK